MAGVPTLEPVAPVGVRWYLREKAGKLYLVKIVFENGRRREYWIGNVEVIEQVMLERKRRGSRPYRKWVEGRSPQVVRPPGFEPGIAGLGGRRPSPG